jgi:hypothetical protein
MNVTFNIEVKSIDQKEVDSLKSQVVEAMNNTARLLGLRPVAR